MKKQVDPKIRKEKQVVYAHNYRASKMDLPATLTIDQWIETLDHFGWKCAYCLEAPYECLDHFFPLHPGIAPLLITIYKGTSADNCVPACRKCNYRKSTLTPELVLKANKRSALSFSFPSEEMIFRISNYLKIDPLGS